MNNVIICLALLAAAGILLCFFGRRFINISLPLIAFIIVMRYVMEHYSQSQYVILIAVLAGIAGALLARFAKRAAFFIIGFIVGFFIGSILCRYITLDAAYGNIIVELLCALVLGFLFVKWNNFFLSIITAYVGGQRLAVLTVFLVVNYASLASFGKPDILTTFQSLEGFMENAFLNAYPIYIFLITVIFMLAGISFQNRRGYRRHR